MPIHLGFIEELSANESDMDYDQLEGMADNIPHKIGGKPLWLNPGDPLSAGLVKCGVCSNEMSLLFQLFTPEDHPPEAFLRIVYLFACKDGKCHKKSWRDSFKCFRSQLPEENQFWGGAPSKDDTPTIKPTCRLCGLSGPKRCGKCNTAYYCNKRHQELDWKIGEHSTECTKEDQVASPDSKKRAEKMVLFKEFEVVTELEPSGLKPANSDESIVDQAEVMMRDVGISEADDGVKDEDADFEETETGVDKAFLKFQKRAEREPEQVIRLGRLEPPNGEPERPLWVSDIDIPDNISPCPYCSSSRTYEFQIMPQLLSHLEIDHSNPDALDWGVVVVFTCSALCQPTDGTGKPLTYVEELVFQQPFSAASVQDGMKAKMEALSPMAEGE
ncbi:Programmed cell death protein 2 [Phlyctochytrium planicorne]|nr:Programmed cell death protein 2 [Phlyctochytrium planicorne]